VRSQDGEVESFDDAAELACNLEWFDSADPAEQAAVEDSLGRRVRLKVEQLKIVVLELEE
jgi:hypothetical protein